LKKHKNANPYPPMDFSQLLCFYVVYVVF